MKERKQQIYDRNLEEWVTLDTFFPHDTTITLAGVPSIYILFKWFAIRTLFILFDITKRLFMKCTIKTLKYVATCSECSFPLPPYKYLIFQARKRMLMFL